MKHGEPIILGICGIILVLALATCPSEDLASFDPLGWIADSINKVLDLFFGWMP